MSRVTMTDYYSDKKFIKTADVKKEKTDFTVVSTSTATIGGRRQLILGFKETEKGFGLSKADLQFMIDKFGEETEQWINKKITLQKQQSKTPNGEPTITLHLV